LEQTSNDYVLGFPTGHIIRGDLYGTIVLRNF
jgi:hypothetical protein